MAVSMRSGMISMRSGYLATKLMAMADAFRSQSAWSCRKAGKSDKTVRTHSGRVEAASSSEYFMRSKVGCARRLYQQWFGWKSGKQGKWICSGEKEFESNSCEGRAAASHSLSPYD